MQSRGAAIYRKVHLESAPPQRLLDELFRRLLADIDEARGLIVRRDVKGKARAIDHALRIVSELQAALDHRCAPELTANLAALYDYVAATLASSSAHLDPTPLEGVAKLIGDLREAFDTASAQVR